VVCFSGLFFDLLLRRAWGDFRDRPSAMTANRQPPTCIGVHRGVHPDLIYARPQKPGASPGLAGAAQTSTRCH
jgi:hypothetical protein